ncbi:MAG: hypothetical protein EOM68_18500 [Spirochaetia bacterium]|nr:hypothetical protein [Spirochaetia bacterium]
METWSSTSQNELMALMPEIQSQLNSMSRLQWKMDHDALVAQGFPQSQKLFVSVPPIPTIRGPWRVYMRYYNYEERINFRITVNDMEDLIRVFKGWLVIFGNDMPPATQLQMELQEPS